MTGSTLWILDACERDPRKDYCYMALLDVQKL